MKTLIILLALTCILLTGLLILIGKIKHDLDVGNKQIQELIKKSALLSKKL